MLFFGRKNRMETPASGQPSQEAYDSSSGYDDGEAQRNREREAQMEAMRQNAERQQRKIISMMANERNGRVDVSPLYFRDATVSSGMRDMVLDGYNSGRFGGIEEHQILSYIKDPVHIDGPEGVFSSINSKHELRILGMFTGGKDGFDHCDELSPKAVKSFLAKYATPMEFDSECNDFLDMIERKNDKQKREQYEVAMESFKSKIYGKRQEYWEQMKLLRAEAAARGERMTPASMEQHEWPKGEVGVWQISKGQTYEGFDSRMHADETCQDALLRRDDIQLYGVFDGAGGHEGGRAASRLSRDVVNSYTRGEINSGAALASILNEAAKRVDQDPNAGYSTGVLAKVIDRNGRRMLSYASVGDSRLYVMHKDGTVEQVTQDEGEGNRITNALGMPMNEGDFIVKQWGDIEIRDGDKFMLCSDGITGDYGDQLMSNSEIGQIMSKAKSPSEAAMRLTAAARKHDDRTVIVFEP